MGILDDLLASAAGSGGAGGMGGRGGVGDLGGAARRAPAPSQAPSGGGMSSVLMALLPVVLSMLASRGGGAQQGGLGAGGGGLGDILGQVLGGGAQRGGTSAGGGGGLEDILGGMLGGGGGGGGMGGLGGLLEQMARAGYGDQARSWVGTGQNQPISPDALEQIFGHGGLAEIARQAGVSESDASRGLSELLPEVVDRVTPGGQVPDLDQLAASVSDLSRRLGRA
jgi:uncharacterized protein YidB (DUF937 family)